MTDVVYLWDLDGTGSLHVCSKGDPGAIPHVSLWDESSDADLGLNLVHEFHSAFGIHQPDAPDIPDEPVHTALAIYHQQAARLAEELKEASAQAGGSRLLIRLQLIQEELAAGFISRDPVECLDALTDLSYVVDGTYLTTGLAAWKVPALMEVHRSNMSKLDADGNPVIGTSGRVMKSDQYSPPDLAAVLFDGRDG